jgi:hypothetical protein
MRRSLVRAWAIAVVTAAAGCGGSSSGHVDTGYGANEAVPGTEDCIDFCQRFTDCGVDLCDEDSNSTQYQAFEPTLVTECELTCTDGDVQSTYSAAEWQCLFQKSCRQVFGEDACGGQAHYSCSSG